MNDNRLPTTRLDLKVIRQDGSTQARTAIDEATVEDYAEQMRAGAELPPPVLYNDGSSYWIGDGHHRVRAAIKTGRRKIDAVVWQGDQRDAILHAVGANADHGLRRTNADKRRAIRLLLQDEEWSRWSDRNIADRCRVDHKTVAAMRAELAGSGEIPRADEPRTFERSGKVHEMNVGRINADRRAKPPAVAPDEVVVAEVAPGYTPPTPEDFRNAAIVGGIAETMVDMLSRAQPSARTSVLGEVGNLAAPPGSKEWAIAVRLRLQGTLNSIKGELKHVSGLAGLMREHRGFDNLDDRDGRPFEDFAAFCRAPQPSGLGCEPWWLQRVLGEPITDLPPGVRFDHKSGKFQARRMVDGKRRDLGYFATPEEAGEAYRKAGGEPVPEMAESHD